MRSSTNWSKRLLICLLPLLVISTQSGCALGRRHSEVAGALSDYWAWRAERARFAEAKAEHERSEKEMAKARTHTPGTLEEVVKTDYTITLEKGMEIESIGLDFDEIDKMKVQQAKLDKAYEDALDSYHKLQVAKAKEDLNDNGKEQGRSSEDDPCSCTSVCDCAEPPKAPGIGPPPRRPALGMENLPLVIRARYSLSPRQTAFAKTSVERKFQPGKQKCEPCEPKCCPRCGDYNCTQTGTCIPNRNMIPKVNEPSAAPAVEEARSKEKKTRPAVISDGLHNLLMNPTASQPTLFDGELQPILLSFDN